MIGFLYMLGTLLGGAVSGTKSWIDNERSKNDGYIRRDLGENVTNTYYDRKGVRRDLDTDEYTTTERDCLTGDLWLKQGLPSKRTRNLSQEWRENNYFSQKLNKRPGCTVAVDIQIPARSYVYKEPVYRIPWKNEYTCRGQWYKDLDTGELYVIRRLWYKDHPYLMQDASILKKMETQLQYLDFYMDIKTRKFVRLSDDFIEENKREKEYAVTQDVVDAWKNLWNTNMCSFTPSIDEEIWGQSYWDFYYYNNCDVPPSKTTRADLKKMGNVAPVRLP